MNTINKETIMNNLSESQLSNYQDDIDLVALLKLIWSKKFLVIAVTISFAIGSIVYALLLPNIYSSQAVMLPAEQDKGMGGLLDQYSGMAGLAGISLPSESGSKSQEAIARVQSFKFFSTHFLPYVSLKDLVAAKKWDSAKNNIIYDKKIFDSESDKWIRKPKYYTRSITPSDQEAFKYYLQSTSIREDKKTSVVSLSVQHISPYVAQQWAELIIEKIDSSMRNQDKIDAMKSIEFLNGLSPTVNYEEIKKALSSLQQQQMKRLMMIEGNENYVFKVLDFPIVPEMKYKPQRAFIVILGTFMGLIFGIFLPLAIHFFRSSFIK